MNILFSSCFSHYVKSWWRKSLGIPVGILRFEENNAAGPALPQMNPLTVGIFLEGSFVIDALTNLSQAMCLLLGFTCSLHLEFPKCIKNNFTFIQQVMLNLGRSYYQEFKSWRMSPHVVNRIVMSWHNCSCPCMYCCVAQLVCTYWTQYSWSCSFCIWFFFYCMFLVLLKCLFNRNWKCSTVDTFLCWFFYFNKIKK